MKLTNISKASDKKLVKSENQNKSESKWSASVVIKVSSKRGKIFEV